MRHTYPYRPIYRMAMKITSILCVLTLLALVLAATGCTATDQAEDLASGSAISPEQTVSTPASTSGTSLSIFSTETVSPVDIFEKTQYYQLFNQNNLRTEGTIFPVTYDLGIVHIAPGGYTSEHKVENRSEIIYIIEGEASASVQMVCKGLLPGEAIYIPQGAVQSVTNTGSGNLVYLSAMSPPYTQEADILISNGPGACAKYVAPGPFVLIRDINRTAVNESIATGKIYVNPIMNPDSVFADTGYQLENSFSLTYVMLPPDTAMDPHYLAGTTEADYVISGSATFMINGTKYQVSQGGLIVIPPDQPRYATNDGTEPVELISVCDPMWEPENEFPV